MGKLRCICLWAAVMMCQGISRAADFVVPDAAKRAAAIGDVSGLPPVLRRAFAADEEWFPLVENPGPNDWLANHPEPGQTFAGFLAEKHARPTKTTGILYFLPLGDFPGESAPSLAKLGDFATAFFGLKVSVLPAVPVKKVPAKTRTNRNTHKPQMLSTDVLEWLTRQLPADGFCIIAITMMDLYPEESWNFVFGQASLYERTGVFSFARHDPAFFGEERGVGFERYILERAAKVLAHETGHMFGIRHCVYFRCVMNGSNHLGESDSRPLHLCPVCLRKLHSATGFNVVRREGALHEYFKAAGFTTEQEWSRRRIEQLQSDR